MNYGETKLNQGLAGLVEDKQPSSEERQSEMNQQFGRLEMQVNKLYEIASRFSEKLRPVCRESTPCVEEASKSPTVMTQMGEFIKTQSDKIQIVVGNLSDLYNRIEL